MKINTYMVCPVCKGAGEKEETRGGDGDPEYDVPVTCDCCKGKGEITREYLDEYEEMCGDDFDYIEPTDPRQQPWE